MFGCGQKAPFGKISKWWSFFENCLLIFKTVFYKKEVIFKVLINILTVGHRLKVVIVKVVKSIFFICMFVPPINVIKMKGS